MRKCPFCANALQGEAVKCEHCGKSFDQADPPPPAETKTPWYFGTAFIIIAFCCVGPLALPLLWWRPNTSRVWKIVLTIAVLLLTWLMIHWTIKSIEILKQCYELMKAS